MLLQIVMARDRRIGDLGSRVLVILRNVNYSREFVEGWEILSPDIRDENATGV
jgi:hypothetical protein